MPGLSLGLGASVSPKRTKSVPASGGIPAATAGSLVISFGYFSMDTYGKLSNTQWRMVLGDGEYQQLSWNIDVANTWVLDTNNGEIRATNPSSNSSIIPTTGWVYTIGSGPSITISAA